MKNFILSLIVLCSIGTGNSYSQTVVKQGNTFTQVSNKSKVSAKEVATEYAFKDSKGNTYKVYLSSTGKAYIKKVSKKSGKEYKQYIPEIGKQINPEAYKKKSQ